LDGKDKGLITDYKMNVIGVILLQYRKIWFWNEWRWLLDVRHGKKFFLALPGFSWSLSGTESNNMV